MPSCIKSSPTFQKIITVIRKNKKEEKTQLKTRGEMVELLLDFWKDL